MSQSRRDRRGGRGVGRRGYHTPPAPTKAKRGLADAWPRLTEDLSLAVSNADSWEGFDAAALFDETSRLHVNKVTYTDDRVDADDADSSTLEKGHEDEVTVGQGNPEGEADERELQADTEEGEPPGGQPDEASSSPEAPAEGTDASEAEGQPDVEAGDDAEPESEAAPPESEPQDEDGAEDSIQKESEGIEEAAEATSKTSEDVHGGDEATKDIEDSPNAANDGQNPDNQGAEAGEGGEEGDGSSSVSEADNAEAQAEAEPAEDAGEMAEEDWEAIADHSANRQAFEDSLDEFEAKVRGEEETGHRTSMPSYQFDRDESPAELEVAFKKGRELIQKLAAEEDYTRRVAGTARWEAKELARAAVSYRHARIPSAKFDRPREADIVMLLDISGSCEQQAEMFMAIAAGAVGNGVRIYVGYNGSARAAALTPPRRPLRSYSQAKAWVQSEMDRVSGWENAYAIGEWNFDRFVEEVRPKTCIIFGDWDGIDQYQWVCHRPKFRSTRFFWFANEGAGWRAERADTVPEGWTRKSYFPAVYQPQDLVKALRKLR